MEQPSTQENQENQNSGEERTFKQADVDAIVSKRLGEERTKFDAKLHDAIAQALKEQERQSTLTAEEKANEASKQRQEALDAKERDLTLRENKANAREKLVEKNISTELLDFVVDIDPKVTEDNIDRLAKAFNKAVEQGVDKRVASATPTDPSSKEKASSKKTTAELLYGK